MKNNKIINIVSIDYDRNMKLEETIKEYNRIQKNTSPPSLNS